MSCYFTKIFVYLLVIAAVCYFRVYKLIGQDPALIYLFKVNSRNTKTWSVVCPKLPINTVESRFGVLMLTLKIIHTFFQCFFSWLWIGKCSSESSDLCKYYYPIQHHLILKQLQIFLKAKFSKYLTASSYSTCRHKEDFAFPAILAELTRF